MSGIDKVSKAVSEMQNLIGELVKVLGLAKDSEMAAYMMEFEKALGYVATALSSTAAAASRHSIRAHFFIIVIIVNR